MKKYLLLALIALFAACAENDHLIDIDPIDPVNPVNPIEKCRFKLGLKNQQLDAFYLSEFSLFGQYDAEWDFTLADVSLAYDSIVWGVEGYEERTKIFKTNGYDTQFTFGWGHCFYDAGERYTYLVGYKNNEIVHTDTLRVVVTNDKDCLMYNWSEVTENDKTAHGFQNALKPNCTLAALRVIHDETPGVQLFYTMNIHNGDEVSAQNRMLLYRYFSNTFGKPVYDKDSSQLTEQFQQLFAYQEPDAVPLSIWITGRTKFVLLNLQNEEWNRTYVYAEPNY